MKSLGSSLWIFVSAIILLKGLLCYAPTLWLDKEDLQSLIENLVPDDNEDNEKEFKIKDEHKISHSISCYYIGDQELISKVKFRSADDSIPKIEFHDTLHAPPPEFS